MSEERAKYVVPRRVGTSKHGWREVARLAMRFLVLPLLSGFAAIGLVLVWWMQAGTIEGNVSALMKFAVIIAIIHAFLAAIFGPIGGEPGRAAR